MDFINLSSSMTLLDLIRYLLQDTNNSFSFYSGNLSTGSEENLSNNTELRDACQYICKKVREVWTVHNIGIVAVENGEFMVCVTSPDASFPAEVLSFIVEALVVCTFNLAQARSKCVTSDGSENEESMEEDISPDLIQVNATMKEINERIEHFIRYKRAQSDTNNILDFCGTQSQSCARVDAVLVRKKDSFSHMAVRNVLDRYTSKYNTDKISSHQNCDTTHAAQIHSAAENQVMPVPKQQSIVTPVQKGEKRTYDLATLEEMLKNVKKQQKTKD